MEIKEMIYQFYDEVFCGGNAEAAVKYMQPGYHQHNPGVTDGRDGFIDTFGKAFAGGKKMNLCVQDVVVDGDMVFVYIAHGGPDGKPRLNGHSVCDIYRLEDGKLAEHWDILE